MTVLRSGAVSKLLDAMKADEEREAEEDDVRKPVLLQIRSIIPVLEEGDLWPNRGFYLRVSDTCQAIYVSLQPEQNDMILSNKLKLGQHVYVEKLEKSYPVPVLIGLHPVPGRRLCEGSPVDVNSPTTLSRILQSTGADSTDLFIEEKDVISEEKVSRNSCRDYSDHSDGLIRPRGRRSRSVSAVRTRSSIKVNVSKDDDSDTDSTLSSVSSSNSKRKSWTQSDILEVKEIIDSSHVSRNDVRRKKPLPRCRSANASPVRSLRRDSSDEYSSILNHGRRDVKCTRKFPVKNVAPKATFPDQNSQSLSTLIHDVKGAETAISWTNLPAALVKLGKEVVRQRDLAVSAASDALQEACAAERLLKSLSAYSELNASSEGVDLQTHVDKLSDLQHSLDHNKLIIQSLTKICPFKKSETLDNALISPRSVKETLDIALKRSKSAASWIKSAVSLDLSHAPTNPTSPNMVKKSTRVVKPREPKGPSLIIRKQRSIDNIPHILMNIDKDSNYGLSAATDLASAIQDECRKLFSDYLDKYLDDFESKMRYGGQVGEMMSKVKKVNDLLVLLAGKDECERVAYGRAKEKIYGILLSNIERTLAL